MIDRQYQTQQKIGDLILYFGILALIISCLGLYGLSMFVAERRRKEMGIRKALGSGNFQILALLGKDFLILVSIATVLSWGISWYAMQIWLEQFHYRINLTAGFFILSFVVAVFISILTVMIQSLRVAKANPIESLKHE